MQVIYMWIQIYHATNFASYLEVNAFKKLKILNVGEITELEISLFMVKFYNNQLPKIWHIFSHWLIPKYLVMIHDMQMTVIFRESLPDLVNTHWSIKVQKYGTPLMIKNEKSKHYICIREKKIIFLTNQQLQIFPSN